MSRIPSKWTVPERKVHNNLKGRKIKHKMHPKINGSPDIVLKNKMTAVFIHGCFWHGCPKCYVESKTNREYWVPKIENNKKRDRKNSLLLKNNGFKVVQIWEHELKKCIKSALNKVIMA